MKTMVVCWNVSRVAWFRTLAQAVCSRDQGHEFCWHAVSRAEWLRLRLDGVFASLLPRDAWVCEGASLPQRLQTVDLASLVRYDAALSDAPAVEVLHRRARRYLCWYDSYLEQERPDLLLCVNGWRLHTACAVLVARQRDIPVLFVENGYLPFTTVLDPVGVNYAGSLTFMPLAEKVDDGRLARLVDDYHAGRIGRPATIPGWREYLARGLSTLISLVPRGNQEKNGGHMSVSEVFETWSGEGRRRGKQLDFGKIRVPYVFFPLQVEDDSQLLIHSPWVKSMEQAVRCILAALPREIQLVVKRHPSDRGRTPLEGIMGLLRGYNGAFISDGAMGDLLRDSKAVVTVNSTVGFEALMWHRPVVVLGQAPYAGRGATWDVEGPGELKAKLLSALTSAPNRALVDRVVYTVLFDYLYPGGWKDPRVRELGPAADAILAMRPARSVQVSK